MRKNKVTPRKAADNIFTYAALIVMSVIFLFPCLWLILASLSKTGSLFDFKGFFPAEFGFQTFIDLFTDDVNGLYPYKTWFFNTLYVAVFSSLLGTVLVLLTAYVMDLTQTENDVTAEIAYLIVDQKQVNVFFRLDSDKYEQLEADPDVLVPCGLLNSSYGAENGELRSFTIDFVDEDVPDSLIVYLRVYASGVSVDTAPVEAPEDIYEENPIKEPEYLAEFEFLLEFDPKFTASGKVFPVNQTVILDGQAISITDIEVYPTHMRVDIKESPDNTAWIKDLDFYIETDWGIKFETGSGITATGSTNSPSMISYRADSPYFYEAEHLKLVITGAKWLRKDMQTTYLNLVTGEHGELPEGAVFDKAERKGGDWIVTFRADWDEEEPMYQLFDYLFYDTNGTAYEINQWSSTFGDEDEEGNITCFYDEFPLKNFPYDEVWLSPQFSHYWTAEDLIVITVQ